MPKVEEGKSGKPILQQNTSSMIVETEKRVKKKTPDELLEILKDQCFIRQEGWWSYGFCYQKRLRQIHLEDEKIIPSGESMADHCNVLPKDYKETQVEDEESEIKQIVMVTDGESHSNDDSDE